VLTGDVLAGATTVTLSEDPAGWRVGDELLVPNTAMPQLGIPDRPATIPSRESRVTVAAIAGRTITLSKGLDFDHRAQRDPDGGLVLLPRIANLTRNVIVRSEKANGTRGHTANVGHEATWDIQYNELHDLGRTTVAPLDNTTVDLKHLGTNQVGRYMDHQHHAHGMTSVSRGNVLVGGAKWGMAVHLTHDALIEWNIALELPGAGFVTEDGPETRNVFRKNFAAYVFGNMPNALQDTPKQNVNRNAPGVEGTGFWFRGIRNTFEGNEAWNCSVGMNIFNSFFVQGAFPSAPGGMPDTMFTNQTRFYAMPVSVADNVTASNAIVGLEYWGTTKFPNVRHISSYNGAAQVLTTISDPMKPYFIDGLFVGKDGRGTGIDAGLPYTPSLDIEGGRIVGNAIGLRGGAQNLRVVGTLWQNVINEGLIELPPHGTEHTNVVYKPFPGVPLQAIVFGTGNVWPGTGPLPVVGLSHWMRQQGASIHVIKNWQGTGQDYRLFQPQQLASAAAWHSDGPPGAAAQHRWNCPDVGLTNQQCWDRYGMAFEGDIVKEADVVTLDGIANGLARKGLAVTPLGPPRGIITFPTLRAPAVVQPADNPAGPFVQLYAVPTGQSPGPKFPSIRTSIDGGPVTDNWYPEPFGSPTYLVIRSHAVSVGSHEVRTWRVDDKGATIPASAMVFRYVVGPPDGSLGVGRP
jgi:hypothetical protein